MTLLPELDGDSHRRERHGMETTALARLGLLAILTTVAWNSHDDDLGFRALFVVELKRTKIEVVLAAQFFCWTGQFIGHCVFEKRAPALLDNLTQAFLMAPFFFLLEALQYFFGYEPYPGFHAGVEAKTKSEITEWKEN